MTLNFINTHQKNINNIKLPTSRASHEILDPIQKKLFIFKIYNNFKHFKIFSIIIVFKELILVSINL